MTKKKTPKSKAKKTTEPRHPLPEQLKNIQKKIEESPMFESAAEFIMKLSGLIAEFGPYGKDVSIRTLMETFVDKVEMFVTEKDRVAELVRIKLNYDVKSIREVKGRFMIQVVQDGKMDTIFVKKDTEGDGYIYGHGNFKIGKLSNNQDEK